MVVAAGPADGEEHVLHREGDNARFALTKDEADALSKVQLAKAAAQHLSSSRTSPPRSSGRPCGTWPS